MVQSQALEHFSLPRVDDFLTEMPSVGLYQALKSYLLRGALDEQELFSQLELVQSLPNNFNKALEVERMAREVAEKRVAALEAERVAWTRSEGRWQRELETREEMIKGLQAHHSKQSAMIAKLKEEIGHYKHEILKWDGHIKYLIEEVMDEKRERLDAQECTRSDCMAAQNLKIDLEEERSAHHVSLATIQALEGRLVFLDSEAYRVEIMEKYRNSPLGKVEVSLACKASFDYLLELLLRESRPAPDRLYYLSHVANCLDVLKAIETKGGGIVLDVDDGDEGDEESGMTKMKSPLLLLSRLSLPSRVLLFPV